MEGKPEVIASAITLETLPSTEALDNIKDEKLVKKIKEEQMIRKMRYEIEPIKPLNNVECAEKCADVQNGCKSVTVAATGTSLGILR